MRRGVVALAALVVVGCEDVSSPFETAGVGSLQGRAVVSGVGVAGARVLVRDRRTETDADGRFELLELAPGPGVVFVSSGPLGASREARIPADRRLDLGDIELGAGACVAGRVERADGSLAPPVEVDRPGLDPWTWTRADGRFRLELPPGRHRLRFRGANLEDAEVELEARVGCQPDDATVLVSPSVAAEPLVWLELERQPVPVGAAAVALDGTTLYVAGGTSCPDGSCAASFGATWYPYQVASLQRLDLRTGRWDLGPALPALRGGPDGAVLGDALWVVGGWRTGRGGCAPEDLVPRGADCHDGGCRPCYTDEVLRFDLQTERWSDANDGVPALPAPVAFGRLVTDGRRLLYVGGLEAGVATYSSQIHAFEPGDPAWRTTAFDGRRVHNLAACVGAGELLAFAGAAYWPGPDGREVAPLCSARFTRHGLASGVSRQSAIAPLMPSSMTSVCAVLGDFVYVPMHTKRLEGSVTLRYGMRDDSWVVEPAVEARHYQEVGPTSNLPGGALATPHGLLVTGLGSDHAQHTGQSFVAVAERFLPEAEARYGRARVSTIVDAPPGDAPDGSAWEAACMLRSCGEACDGPEDDRCIPGHACLAGRCLPRACVECPGPCVLSPADRPAPIDLRIEGERYLACPGAQCP